MSGPKDYFAQRKDEALTDATKVASLLQQLAEVGNEADKLLTRAQMAKATSTPQEAQAFERVVQTLGALSREAWIAHDSIITVSRIYHQLIAVESEVLAQV